MQKIWLLIFLVFHTYGVRAQNTQYTHFGTQDGLPSNEVYFVHQDTLGYLWFGTDRGLSRFDGYKFVTYTTQNSGLTNNTVLKVFESPDKNLWLACYDGSVSILNPYTNRVSEFEFNDTLKKAPYWVEHVVFDCEDVKIYMRSSSPSCFEYNSEHHSISHEGVDSAIFLKHFNRGTSDTVGMDTITGEIYQRIRYRDLSPHKNNIPLYHKTSYFRCLSQNRHNTTYFAYRAKLYAFEIDTITPIASFPEPIHHIYLDPNNPDVIFLPTNRGLYQILPQTDTPKHIIPTAQCSYIIKDFEDNYWVTTLNHGIYMFRSNSLFQNNHKYDALKHCKIKGLGTLNSQLIIGTSDERILSMKDIHSEPIELINGIDTLPTKLEVNKLIKHNGALYCTGSLVVKTQNLGFKLEIIPNPAPLGITYPINDSIYLGTGHIGGYCIIGLPNGNIKVRNKLGNEIVQSISCDKDGTFWLGTLNGIWKIEPSNLNHAYKLSNHKEQFGRINQIIQVGDITVLATDDQGVFLMKDNAILKLDTKSGMASDMASSLVNYEETLWVGTNKGLSKIVLSDTLENCHVEFNYSFSDGLASNFVHSLAIWNNQLCIGLDGHVQIIPLNKLTNLQSAPKIHFEKILVNHLDSFEFSDTLFDYNQNDISIYYVGISFKKPDNDFYRYRLVRNGDTSTKFTLSNNTSIDFFDLVPGHYVFEVACQNKNNIWSTTQHFGFRITPHFSETLWFKLLIIFLTCIFLLLFISWRFRDIRRKSRQTAQIQQLEFKFKESELAMLRNQMNPHFVFNAMNSILSYVLENDVETAARYIQRFSTLMRSSLEYSADQWLSLSKEIEFLSNYLHIEQLRFPNRFTYDITYSNNIDDPDDISIPSLLVQPIVENAVKHAFGANTTDGHIAVHFEREDLYLICTITDNGIGINHSRTQSKVKPKSFGIQVVTNRLKLLNLEGAEALLTIIDRSSESDNTHGTRVTIRIPTD